MAISGSFIADFQSFYDAAQKAEVSLKSFEGGAGKVESALNRMVDNFSGRKIIQDATLMTEAFDRLQKEGIKLTDDELQRMAIVAQQAADKLKTMGQDVPANLQAIANEAKHAGDGLGGFKTQVLEVAGALGLAFSAAAVVQWGKSMVDSVVQASGALVDMNAKTGDSIEQLQRFAFVGKQANVSVEDFSQASFKLGVNLAGGSGSVRQAVADLGLSYEKLRAKSPDDQFNNTIAALERMIEPQERNRLAVELFAKSFATIAPAVAKGYTEMAAQATVASAAQVKAIDDASDALDRWVAKQKTSFTSALGNQILYGEALHKLSAEQVAFLLQTDRSTDSLKGFELALIRAAAAGDLVLPSEKKQTDASADYAKQLALAEQQVSNLTAAETAGIAAALKLGESHDKIAVAFHLSDQALAIYIETTKKAAQSEIDTIKAASERSKLEAEGQKIRLDRTTEVNKEIIASFQEIQKAERILREFEAESTLNSTDFKVLKIWEEANAQIAAFKGTEDQRAQFKAVILTLAEDQAQQLYAIEAESAVKTVDQLKRMTDAEAAALLSNGQWLDYLVLKQTAARDAQDKLTASLERTAGVLNEQVAAAFQGYAAQLDKLAVTPGSSLGFGHGQAVQSTITVPSRDVGGSGIAGQSYLIGTGAQPELFTPSTSGSFTPNASDGGGGTQIIQLVVDGKVLTQIVTQHMIKQTGGKFGGHA